jgi:hypothetical protein
LKVLVTFDPFLLDLLLVLLQLLIDLSLNFLFASIGSLRDGSIFVIFSTLLDELNFFSVFILNFVDFGIELLFVIIIGLFQSCDFLLEALFNFFLEFLLLLSCLGSIFKLSLSLIQSSIQQFSLSGELGQLFISIFLNKGLIGESLLNSGFIKLNLG